MEILGCRAQILNSFVPQLVQILKVWGKLSNHTENNLTGGFLCHELGPTLQKMNTFPTIYKTPRIHKIKNMSNVIQRTVFILEQKLATPTQSSQ